MFLAVTSVGWGFNWPVTKYLLSELPPLTLRGGSGVIGAALLAAACDACAAKSEGRRRALAAPNDCGGAQRDGLDGADGPRAAWLPASEAALIAYTMPVWASLLAWPVLGERPTVLRRWPW